MTGVLVRRDSRTQRGHRMEGHLKMESEHGVMLPQAKDRPGLLAATRSEKSQGYLLPQSLWRECGPTSTLILDFQPSEL